MRLFEPLLLLMPFIAMTAIADDLSPGLGQAVADEEAARLSFTVMPDGQGLPPGQGTAAEGQETYLTFCSACHGQDGQQNTSLPLAGGEGTLATDRPLKTVGSYWPLASTLFDYTRRAMPYGAQSSLTDDQYYSVTAYVLYLNDLLEFDQVIDSATLPEIEMPNRNGFFPAVRPPGRR